MNPWPPRLHSFRPIVDRVSLLPPDRSGVVCFADLGNALQGQFLPNVNWSDHAFLGQIVGVRGTLPHNVVQDRPADRGERKVSGIFVLVRLRCGINTE